MSLLKRMVVEVHRRSLWQVLLIYCGGAWFAYQVVWTFTESLGLPTWFPRVGLILLIVLLPVVLATAFVQEGVGERVPRRTILLAAVIYVASALVGFYLVMGLTRQFELPDWLPGFVAVLLIVLLPAVLWTAFVKGEAVGEPGGIEPSIEQGEASGLRVVLTWRNAFMGAVVLFALLGVAVTGYMAMRLMGIGPVGTLIAKGMIERRDRIILADFENHTSDSTLALTVTEAFRVDFEQSPTVELVSPSYVNRVLAMMERSREVPLDLDLAREVAIRGGLKAVIAGEVNAAGSGFVISVRLVAVETGDVLAVFRETATDLDHIVSATDRVSNHLRRRIGESLKTIQANEPLAEVTTHSLEALRKYSEAVRVYRQGAGVAVYIALAEEAIALDSAFADAHGFLGLRLFNLDIERGRAVAHLTKAYELRHRQTDRRRYITAGLYYVTVEGDYQKARDAFQTLNALYPESGLMRLGVIYEYMRDYARAEEYYRRAIEADSTNGDAFWNLVSVQLRQGKLEEVGQTIERSEERFGPSGYGRLGLELARGNLDGAEAQMRSVLDDPSNSLVTWPRAHISLSQLSALRGKVRDAEQHITRAMTIYADRSLAANYLAAAVQLGLIEVCFRGTDARGIDKVEAALERFPLDSIDPLERPYTDLVQLYALAGQLQEAKALLSEYQREVDPSFNQFEQWGWRERAIGAVALAEGRYRDALTQFRLSDYGICEVCALPALGRTYELLNEPDSAVSIYERYVTTPEPWRAYWDVAPLEVTYPLPGIYERLGALYEQRGDTSKAIYYYGKFAELWKDADPELQPRVEAARRAIEALSPDR